MYKQHDDFVTPDDAAIFWRYMDFAKFVSLLDRQRLFFPSVPTLRTFDPFEGTLAHANILATRLVFQEIYKEMPIEEAQPLIDALFNSSRLFDQFHNFTVVNCWYMNNYESAAMWKIYGDAIAVQTSCARLKNSLAQTTIFHVDAKSLDLDVFIGQVQYTDFEVEFMRQDNAFYPVLHKRKSFQHESEVRAVTNLLLSGQFVDPNKSESESINELPSSWLELKHQGGIYLPVDLKELVEGVVVSPVLPDWYKELVESVTQKYGLDIPVIQSDLYRAPIY
jgi:hypothetical protein